MAKIIWTETALSDLEAITEYLNRNSPAFARQIIGEIFSRVEPLADFPEIGRIIPEICDPSRREIFCYAYRIMYLMKRDEIYIESVYHGARDFTP